MIDPLLQDQDDYEAFEDAKRLDRKYGRSSGGGCCSLLFYALIVLVVFILIGSIIK